MRKSTYQHDLKEKIKCIAKSISSKTTFNAFKQIKTYFRKYFLFWEKPQEDPDDFLVQIPLYQVQIVWSRSNHNNNFLVHVFQKLDKKKPYNEILYNMLVTLYSIYTNETIHFSLTFFFLSISFVFVIFTLLSPDI